MRYDCSTCEHHEVFFVEVGDMWFDDGCLCNAAMDDLGWHEACCRAGGGWMCAKNCPWYKEIL